MMGLMEARRASSLDCCACWRAGELSTGLAATDPCPCSILCFLRLSLLAMRKLPHHSTDWWGEMGSCWCPLASAGARGLRKVSELLPRVSAGMTSPASKATWLDMTAEEEEGRAEWLVNGRRDRGVDAAGGGADAVEQGEGEQPEGAVGEGEEAEEKEREEPTERLSGGGCGRRCGLRW